MSLRQLPISIGLETAKFIFTPPELPAVANAGKQPSCEHLARTWIKNFSSLDLFMFGGTILMSG
jgi:hypothetical protein